MPSPVDQVKESFEEALRLFKKYVAGTLEEASMAKLAKMLLELPPKQVAELYQEAGMQLEPSPQQNKEATQALPPQDSNVATPNPTDFTPFNGPSRPEENLPSAPKQSATLHPTQHAGLTDQQKMQKKANSFPDDDDDVIDTANVQPQPSASMADQRQAQALNTPLPQQPRPTHANMRPQPAMNTRAAATTAQNKQASFRQSIVKHVTTVAVMNKRLTNLKIDANEDRTTRTLDAIEDQTNQKIDTAEDRSNHVLNQNRLTRHKSVDLARNNLKMEQDKKQANQNEPEATADTPKHTSPSPFKMIPKPFDPESF